MNPTDYYRNEILAKIPKGAHRQVFLYLLDNADRMVTKEQLMLGVFGRVDDPDDQNKPLDRKVRKIVQDLRKLSDVNIWTYSGEAGYWFATKPNDEIHNLYRADFFSRIDEIKGTMKADELNYDRLKERYAQNREQPVPKFPRQHITAPFEAVQMPLIPEQRVYA